MRKEKNYISNYTNDDITKEFCNVNELSNLVLKKRIGKSSSIYETTDKDNNKCRIIIHDGQTLLFNQGICNSEYLVNYKNGTLYFTLKRKLIDGNSISFEYIYSNTSFNLIFDANNEAFIARIQIYGKNTNVNEVFLKDKYELISAKLLELNEYSISSIYNVLKELLGDLSKYKRINISEFINYFEEFIIIDNGILENYSNISIVPADYSSSIIR